MYFCPVMRILAFIFACVLFGQSMSVCAPEIYRHVENSENSVCTVVKVDVHEDVLPACCKKGQQNQEPSDDEHDCCGDNCKCLCCAKLFVKSVFYAGHVFTPRPAIIKNIFPEFFYSFDYHADSFHPPQLG